MAPRFSILLPTHNRADVIGFAIESVLWQTEQDFELLIVGDGCTDRTAEVVSAFDDPRIRWFDLPKAPLSGYANRNIVLRQARGHYVAYAQHDDIMFPDHLTRLVEVLETGGAGWGYSRPLWVTTDGLVVPLAVDLTKPDDLQYFLKFGNSIPSCCVMHTRDSLVRAGYWPERIPSIADWLCWRRIIRAGTAVAYCPAPTVLHFRAKWKLPGKGDPALVVRFADIARNAVWWPAALKMAVSGAVPEQAFFIAALRAEGMGYGHRVRDAVEEIFARLSWRDLVDAVLAGEQRPMIGKRSIT
jgi:glycosyltransferase involved in cell wall biosynthesis